VPIRVGHPPPPRRGVGLGPAVAAAALGLVGGGVLRVARLMPYEHCPRAQEMTVRAARRWPRQVWTIQPASV
jgi:hypothetical protein